MLSICESRVSASDLLRAGIPTTDGFGAIHLTEYTRFLHLVRHDTPLDLTTRLGGRPGLPARLDLLDLLNVTHVLTCEPIDDEPTSLPDLSRRVAAGRCRGRATARNRLRPHRPTGGATTACRDTVVRHAVGRTAGGTSWSLRSDCGSK